MNIGFIGTGKLGMPCAEVMSDNGHCVKGYDLAECSSDTIYIVDSIKECVVGSDIVFVAVPTPHDPDYDGSAPTAHLPPKDFDYQIVKQVLAEANSYMNKDQLLVLISTVLPGTTRREFVELVNNTRFVYNPYLIAMGSVKWDMANPEMVMIGTCDGNETGDAGELIEFYKTIMNNNPRYVVSTWDECECIKVFYNTFISTKIGLVNMIQDVAQKQGNINVDVVTKALAESNMRIMGKQYMTAGLGDGGSCVLPNFLVKVDDIEMPIEELYQQYHVDKDQTRVIKSSNYACSSAEYKKISQVTTRQYKGNMYRFIVGSSELITTNDHLIPVWRDNTRLVVRAEDILETDKLYMLDN